MWQDALRFVYVQDKYDDDESQDAQDGGEDEHERVARARPV